MLIQEALSMEDLDLKSEVALTRVRYLKVVNDPDADSEVVLRYARALTQLVRTQSLVDKTYDPLEENESVPNSRLES